MAEYDQEEAQKFQDDIVRRVRETERMLDTEVIQYYTNDRVDGESDYYENLRGLRNYLRDAYRRFDQMMIDIDRRLE